MKEPFNARVLVIDDEETIRDSFREILTPQKRNTEGLEKASEDLFGPSAGPPGRAAVDSAFWRDFEVETAAGGRAGLERVERAVAGGRPFAAIFVDMRMPGWDGLTTVRRIREVDRRAEVVFVTAYSDYDIDEVVGQAGINVSYHCKPFSVEEIRQIATKAVYEWNKARSLESLIEVISDLRVRRWQLRPLLKNILQQVSDMLGSSSAVLAEWDTEDQYRPLIGIGRLADPDEARPWLAAVPDLNDTDIHYNDRLAGFRVADYAIVVLLDEGMGALNNERIYLVRLFLEQAALAVTNVDLQETLIRNEKLSAVGQAISMVAHDLRGPIGGIRQGIELTDEMADDPELIREMHRMILKEADNALAIVDDILDFTQKGRLTVQTLAARPFLDEVAESCGRALNETGTALTLAVDNDFSFSGDRSKMRRVLINLVKNAAEALSAGPADDPRITLSAGRQSDGVRFSVSDNGPGLPEEIRRRLFVPFVTQGKSGGTGLGLAIARQFVEAHGGRISVASSADGTTFTISIPEAPPEAG